MRNQKVLGTLICGIPYLAKIKMEELSGYRNYQSQYRIICKCTSMADANRKCNTFPEIFRGNDYFKTNWCCETGNELEISLCDSGCDIWICMFGTLGTRENCWISAARLGELIKKQLTVSNKVMVQ